jgi:hypothetical protein
MRFGRIVVMFGSLVVIVLRHWISSDEFYVATVNLLGPDWFQHRTRRELALEAVQPPRNAASPLGTRKTRLSHIAEATAVLSTIKFIGGSASDH